MKLPNSAYTKEALQAVTRDGKTYAVPHWLCGNFLFYKKGGRQIKNVKTWRELNTILKQRNESIVMDFKGKSTLGEWYLTALSARYGLHKAQIRVLNSDALDQEAVSDLSLMLQACLPGYCRSDDLHDRTGYYSRAFIAGESGAYVGYSESIHYGIQYAIDNCTSTSGCITEDDIAVRKLPALARQDNNDGIGWVDALAIDARLSGARKALALKFIEFIASSDTYKVILQPGRGQAPRYLIPANSNMKIEKTSLYLSFYKAHAGRSTGTLPGLNIRLRALGKKLDCKLPISRTDTQTLKACGN